MVKRNSKKTNVDFDFFTQLHDFYRANKGRIRNNYRNITKRFLDHNNPDRNPKAFLRQPQFEALEIYVFLKEYLNNAPVHEIFDDWAYAKDKFKGRTYAERSGQIVQEDLLKQNFREQYEIVFKRMKANARDYSNYIFALTMGTGKTILMATCIFYEFILANKFPKDKRYCKNALVFAPDKTVLQSLREIQTFDMTKVVPAEYVNFLNSHIRFYFLDEAGVSLNTIDKTHFNVIISNTQKIILKKNTKEKSPLDKLLESGKPDYQPNSVYDQNADLYGFDEPDDEVSLSTNQRFEKLRRIEQLGIYIDEAHHVFGTKLANTIGIKTTKTSLRLTVDELANSLRKAGTQVVACYNYTGTPYVGTEVLPEVVYAYGLRQAIDNKYLKKVRINGYTNTRTNEFVEIAIADFLKHNSNQRHEGMLPKMALFASNIDELTKELRPAVEKALEKHGIPSSSILVNVGDPKLTTNDDEWEFNHRLDTPGSEKQFILLVNKGREGWNCRSLFGVALFRKPKSKIFVLQATMRCLRAIGTAQPTGHVYLSEDNKSILEKELDQNFRISISDLEKIGKEKEVIEINPVPPPVTITLKRVRKKYDLVEKKKIATGINLELDKVETDKYRIIHTEQEGLTVKDAGRHKVREEDLTDLREKREFSEITLVAEISRYLNKSCLFIENILATTQEGTDEILDKINEFNEVLYDWVIPRLFKEFYDIDEQEDAIDEYPVQLVKLSKEGFRFSASEDMIARQQEAGELVTKSFHLDTYCFDSKPEKTLFWDLLKDGKIKKIYFTGMLTHGQSDFYIQYIDPDSHTVRSYYPDFLFQRDDDSYVIVEVKADGLIDEPVVQAKKQYAEQWAGQNEMTYKIIASSDAEKGNYASIL